MMIGTELSRTTKEIASEMTVINGNNASIDQYEREAHRFADAVHFEKTSIVAPAIKEAFNRAVHDGTFMPKHDRIVDIGCGPFFLALPFLKDGNHVDGIDSAAAMRDAAKKTLKNSNVPINGCRLVASSAELNEGDYSFGMLNFVHQCAATRGDLVEMFEQASSLLKPGSHMVLTSAHPRYLHVPHSACVYDVADSNALQDGDVYTGAIYDTMGNKAFQLEGDHFWSVDTLIDTSKEAGFRLLNLVDIADKDSLARTASREPAYMIMTFSKQREKTRPGPRL